MAIFEVDDDNFEEIMDREFEKGNIIILKFGSVFCEPCSALEMELEQIDETKGNENISIVYVDTDESPEIAESFDVYQLPTMIIFKDKENIIYENEGVLLYEDIQKILNIKGL